MRAKEAFKFTSGSIAVYLVVASCGAWHTLQGATDGGSDALTDPVEEAAADPYQSGTRLKAKYLAGADGSKQFAGWHDSMLNVDCAFVLASDGKTHCMPSATSSSPYFSDANCTQHLVSVTKGCAPASYGQSADYSGCGPFPTHVYQIGSQVTPGVNIYFLDGSGGACTASPSSSYAEYDFYAVGSELDPSNYVQATTQTEP